MGFFQAVVKIGERWSGRGRNPAAQIGAVGAQLIELLFYGIGQLLAARLTSFLYALEKLVFAQHLRVKFFHLQRQPGTRLITDLRISHGNARAYNQEDDHRPERPPALLPALAFGNHCGQRRLRLLLLLFGVAHFGAQTIVRRLLAKLGPNAGEQFRGFKWEAQNIVRSEIERAAAFQSSAMSEQDDLYRRRNLVAFELSNQAAAVERGDIGLKQNEVGPVLKNGWHICVFRR